jgi:hypothetical protein
MLVIRASVVDAAHAPKPVVIKVAATAISLILRI